MHYLQDISKDPDVLFLVSLKLIEQLAHLIAQLPTFIIVFSLVGFLVITFGMALYFRTKNSKLSATFQLSGYAFILIIIPIIILLSYILYIQDIIRILRLLRIK